MIDRKKVLDEIFDEITQIKRKMEQESRQFFVNSEITHAQWMVVRFIYQQDGANIKELADNLEVTSSAITQLVDGLVKKNYLERSHDETDRRVINLVLTKKREERLAEIKAHFVKKFAIMLDVMSDQELKIYGELNRKIIKNWKKD